MEHDPAVTRFLFDQARDIILVIRADDGRLVDANRAATAAYGYSRAELAPSSASRAIGSAARGIGSESTPGAGSTFRVTLPRG